jgi:integrase
MIANFKASDERERYLTVDEEERLLGVCPKHLRCLVMFFLGTGARHDEGVKLRWDQLDLKKTKDGRSSVTFGRMSTKSDKTRTAPLPRRIAVLLRRMRPKDTARQPRVFLWMPPGKKQLVPFDDPKRA